MIALRTAETEDASEISELIRSVAHYFTVDSSGVGADQFFETITTEAIAGYINDPDFDYLVAVDDSKIVGVGATRDSKLLYHFFVAESHHGQGISCRLWEHLYSNLMATESHAPITVFSTVYAVPVYEKFGFVKTSPKVEKDGIAFVPMELARNTV